MRAVCFASRVLLLEQPNNATRLVVSMAADTALVKRTPGPPLVL